MQHGAMQSLSFLTRLSSSVRLQAPTYMVSVENSGLRGGGMKFKNEIWDAVRPTIEAWTGMKLKPTSLYGIRVRSHPIHVALLRFPNDCLLTVFCLTLRSTQKVPS